MEEEEEEEGETARVEGALEAVTADMDTAAVITRKDLVTPALANLTKDNSDKPPLSADWAAAKVPDVG